MENQQDYTSAIGTVKIDTESNELDDLLEEVQCWAEKERLHITQFYRNNMLRSSKCVKAQTIDLSQVDTLHLEKVLANCKDEFVKVRIPIGVNVNYDIISLYNNNSAECRRRERAKAIAEYLV